MRLLSQGRPARARWGMRLTFVAVTFFALVAGGPALAADKGHGKTDAAALIGEMLAKGKAPEPNAAKRHAARLQGDDRLRYLAVAEELRGESAWRRQNLPPLLENRREKATALPELVCLLATAYAQEKDFAAAERFLNLIDDPTPLTQADVASARARIAIGRGEPDAAMRESSIGWELLNRPQESSAADTETAKWRRKLIERRLSAAGAEATQATALRDGGPAYAAWLKADTLKRPELYEGVIKDYPDTVFATAAALERAMQLLDEGKLAEAGALLQKKAAMADCLTAPREMLLGDVALCRGELKTARKSYEAALKAAVSPAPLPNDWNEKPSAFLTPEQPLHRFDAWHNDIWFPRPAGKIIIPAVSPANANYWRYLATVRLSATLYLLGDKDAAALTAMTVNSFDPVDMELESNRAGSAGTLLAQLYRDGHSQTVPLEFLDHAPGNLRAQLLTGLALFHAYDDYDAYQWFSRALARPKLKGLARDGALLGAGWAVYLAPDNKPRALELLEQVRYVPGHKTNAIWAIAKKIECEVIINSSHTDAEYDRAVEKTTAICEEVMKKLGKKDEYAFFACFWAARYNSEVAPIAAKKYFLRLLEFDPELLNDEMRETINEELKRIEDYQKGKGK